MMPTFDRRVALLKSRRSGSTGTYEVFQRGPIDPGIHRRHRPIECCLRIRGKLRANDLSRALLARSFGSADLPMSAFTATSSLPRGASEPPGPFRDGCCLREYEREGRLGGSRWWWSRRCCRRPE